MKERLQKLLAQASIGSRRASEELIGKGRVRVNGAVAKIGDQADPERDQIEVDGVLLKFEPQAPIYIMLNKPKQVLSTDKPHKGDRRETVSGLLHRDEHLFSIGRLDADSEGLVVMTNDGDLAQRLSHPKYRHTKTYRVEVLGLPTAETLEKWQTGVFLEDGKTAPCFVEIVKGSPRGTLLRIVMTEGKKRQIRRVAALLGHPVRRLTRTHIGMLALGDLEAGQSRPLTAKELVALKTPSPEIRELRASPRRRVSERTSASADAPRSDKRRSTRTQSDEETSRPRRRTDSDEEAPRQRRTSRVKPADADEETPRPRRTTLTARAGADEEAPRPRRRISERGVTSNDAPQSDKRRTARTAPDNETPRPRRTARVRPADATDETPRPRRRLSERGTESTDAPRTDRRRPSRASSDDETPRPRRTARVQPTDATNETPRPRRTARVTPTESTDDTREKRRAPRDRKPESTKEGGKTRPPKPFAPFKKRGPIGKRRPGSGKGRQR